MASSSPFSDKGNPFRADLDVQGFGPTDGEVAAIETEIARLKPIIADFPTKILHVNIEYNRTSNDYEVKLALVLPGQTFATGRVTEAWEVGLESSVQNLIRRVAHYKSTMSGEMEHAHAAAGTAMEITPDWQIDGEAVRKAIEADDYPAFRSQMMAIEPRLRERIGRWVQRYPVVQMMIGDRITIADLVEEVFLHAFDQYDQWHSEMFFGQWLETLIDPVVRAVARDPKGEVEAISFQRVWSEPQ